MSVFKNNISSKTQEVSRKSVIIIILLVSINRYIVDSVKIYVLCLTASFLCFFRIILLTQINPSFMIIVCILTFIMNCSFSSITILLIIISSTSDCRNSRRVLIRLKINLKLNIIWIFNLFLFCQLRLLSFAYFLIRNLLLFNFKMHDVW